MAFDERRALERAHGGKFPPAAASLGSDARMMARERRQGGAWMSVVRLFLADARALAGREAESLPLLTQRRREEAAAFRDEGARLLHCAAGLLLRRVLDVARDDDLAIGPMGKPSLERGGVEFNLSHAGHYAVLAVSRETVGVDVEPVRPPHVLPRKVFTQAELDWLAAHPGPRDFCLLWTRLESALKAEGRGLAAQCRAFSLLEPGTPWYWESLDFDGHLFTCCTQSPPVLRCAVLSAADLLP